MRRPTSLAILAATLLVLPFAVRTARAQDASAGAITGSVFGVDDDLMPTVMILAFDPDSSDASGGQYMAMADPNGVYRIDGVVPGSYFVLARSPEYEVQYYAGTTSMSDATPVAVAAGDEVAGIDFHLARPGAGTGSISGTIVAEDTGLPLAARIRVTDPFRWNVAFVTATDDSGHFLVEGVASGSYLVHAMAEGHVGEYFDDARTEAQATRVTVTEPNETPGIDFALARAGAITGQVLERDGLPLEGARITAWPVSDPDSTIVIPSDSSWGSGDIGPDGSPIRSGPGGYSASSGPAGRYRIDGLPPGLYRVSAQGWTLRGSVTIWYDGVMDPSLATQVGVRSGATVGAIDFKLPIATGEGSIEGAVTDRSGRPVAGAYVNAVDPLRPASMECCPGWGGTTTDRFGRYVLAGLPPGDYLVYAASYGQWTYVERWFPDAETPDGAEPVPVIRDEATVGIDIVLPVNEVGASISGTVTDTSGEPLAWAQVLVQDRDSVLGIVDRIPIQAWAWTDSSGAYTAGGLPAGTYVVSASWWDGDRYGHAWYDAASTFEEATPIVLVDDDELTGIDVVLDPEYWYGGVGGQVVDETGEPMERALVQVHPMSADAGYAPFRYREPHAVTDSEGRFVIGRLPVGEYLVRAFGDGAFAWYDGVPVAALATPVPVTGGDTTVVRLELESRGGGTGVIEGRVTIDQTVDWAAGVTDPADTVPPIAVVTARPTVSVLMWPFSERFWPAVTREDGTYAIVGLPAGEYVVRAFAPDFVSEYYDDAYDAAGADPVNVDGTTPAAGIDFALIPMYWTGAADGAERAGGVGVRGAISDESGTGVTGATVFLMNTDGVAVASTQTAPDGTYVFDGVLPGAYRLMVAKEGFAASFNGGAPSLDAAPAIDLSVGILVVDVTLRTASSTGSEGPAHLPATFVLRGNYPNPFNPATTVLVDLPEAAEVGLQVFDLLGRRVLDVQAGLMSAGEARPILVDGGALASGIYLYRVQALGATRVWRASGTMTLVK